MAAQIKTALTILRCRQVEKRVGLTRSPLYSRIKDGTFPKPIRLGNGRAVGWIEGKLTHGLTNKSRRAVRLEGWIMHAPNKRIRFATADPGCREKMKPESHDGEN